MQFDWIFLGLAGLTLAYLFLFALFCISGDQDGDHGGRQDDAESYSDVSIAPSGDR